MFNHPQDSYWNLPPPPEQIISNGARGKKRSRCCTHWPKFQDFHSWSPLVRGTMLIHSHSVSKAYANPALSPPSPIKPTSVLREELAGQTRATEPFAAEGRSQPRSGALQEQKTTWRVIRRSPPPSAIPLQQHPNCTKSFFCLQRDATSPWQGQQNFITAYYGHSSRNRLVQKNLGQSRARIV